MTTEVEIRANHGWPVKVTLQHKPAGGPAPEPETLIIPTGERKILFVHSHLDLIIHEIQPHEPDFEKGVTPGIKSAVGHATGVASQGVLLTEIVKAQEPL
jgi:hypothetical protein